MERFPGSEDPTSLVKAVGQRCRKCRVSFIAADGGGNGFVYNRLLADELQNQVSLYGLIYSASDHAPTQDAPGSRRHRLPRRPLTLLLTSAGEKQPLWEMTLPE